MQLHHIWCARLQEHPDSVLWLCMQPRMPFGPNRDKDARLHPYQMKTGPRSPADVAAPPHTRTYVDGHTPLPVHVSHTARPLQIHSRIAPDVLHAPCLGTKHAAGHRPARDLCPRRQVLDTELAGPAHARGGSSARVTAQKLCIITRPAHPGPARVVGLLPSITSPFGFASPYPGSNRSSSQREIGAHRERGGCSSAEKPEVHAHENGTQIRRGSPCAAFPSTMERGEARSSCMEGQRLLKAPLPFALRLLLSWRVRRPT